MKSDFSMDASVPGKHFMSLKREVTYSTNANSDRHLCFLYKTVNGPLDVIPCTLTACEHAVYSPHEITQICVFLHKKISSLIRGSYLIKKEPPFLGGWQFQLSPT